MGKAKNGWGGRRPSAAYATGKVLRRAVGAPRPLRRVDPRPVRAGFTLIEVMLVIGVVMVALLALSRSVGTSMKLHEVNRESALAMNGIRETMELLQGVEDFREIFALYNDDPSDDPGVPGSAPGSGFRVAGLSPVPGDPDGLVGEIRFPTLDVGGDLELHEDLDDPSFGMPRDLDGDGFIDGEDHSGDYSILPVVLRLHWTGQSGERSMEVRTLLADR